MSANRKPFIAPSQLLSMSKVTLADLVWEFAAYAASNVDDIESRCQAIRERLEFVKAPRADIRIAKSLYEGVK